jgi:hypothetical protein
MVIYGSCISRIIVKDGDKCRTEGGKGGEKM